MRNITILLFAISILIIGITQVLSVPQYTPDTNNGQLPEDSSSSVPTLDLSELDDYYTDNDVFTAEVEEIAELKKELKDLKEIDKEFMTKVLTKLEIQAENAAMQNQKITKLDTVETSLENLSVVVSRQGRSLNDTAALLNDHTFQITNLTKRFERLAQAPEDEEDEDEEDEEDQENEIEEDQEPNDTFPEPPADEEIVEVVEAVEETIIPAVVVPKYKCPTEKKGYKIIQKQCYFIETARRKFGDAQDNCKKVFDNRKEGRVFEPRTTERNDEVLAATVEVAGGTFNYWLGITDENEEGIFQYSSDDHFVKEELLNKSWFNEGGASEPNGGKGQNCVYAFARNLKWFDFRCSRSRVYSICELPITTPIIGKGAE